MGIRFHPDADAELAEARQWYAHQRKGLDAEFMLCVEEALQRIVRTPKSYSVAHRQFRRAVVRRFPFAIFYEVTADEIRVMAVFHSRRNPKRWKSRV